MFPRLLLHSWCVGLVSLIVLVADLGAPFRTTEFGRVFLACLELEDEIAPSSSMGPIKDVSEHDNSALGYRAITGVVKVKVTQKGCSVGAQLRRTVQPGRGLIHFSPPCSLVVLSGRQTFPPLRC